MAFTTVKDLIAIQNILSKDEIVQGYGYVSESIHIYDYTDDELSENDKYITITPAPSIGSGDGQSVEVTLQYEIVVVSHINYIGNAYNVCDRIKDLLNDTDIGNNHILSILEPTVIVDMEKGMRMLSQAFLCPVTISAIRDPKKPIHKF